MPILAQRSRTLQGCRGISLVDPRTVLSPTSECQDETDSVGYDQAYVHKIDERPARETGELRRDEWGTHRSNAVYSMQNTHLGGGVFGEAGKEGI